GGRGGGENDPVTPQHCFESSLNHGGVAGTASAADYPQQDISAATQSMIGPADRCVMPILAGIIPSHPVIAERAPRCAYSERQLVGTDRVAGARPHLSARMHGWQRIDRHLQVVRNFSRSLLAINPIGNWQLLHP